jgi:branched-chain amino acid transport system permease protein
MSQLLENILQTVVAGVLTGSIYGLMCVGLALIFGVMRVINFAQGDFMMLGMYAAYYLFGLLGLVGVQAVFGTLASTYVAILLAVPLLYGVGYAVHATLISRVSGTRTALLDGEGHYAQLILTLGIALMMTNGAQMVFGSVMAALRTPLTTAAWEIPLGGISVFLNKSRGIAALASVLAIVLISLLINRSALGRALRASADNPVAATYMGIDVNKAHRVAFAMGVAITALAGGLLATNYPFHPFVGLEYVIVMYAGVAMGGMGSVTGAFWGGLTIGLVQQISTLVLPTQLQNTAIFVAFLLIVFFRPRGFFGRNVERT